MDVGSGANEGFEAVAVIDRVPRRVKAEADGKMTLRILNVCVCPIVEKGFEDVAMAWILDRCKDKR